MVGNYVGNNFTLNELKSLCFILEGLTESVQGPQKAPGPHVGLPAVDNV